MMVEGFGFLRVLISLLKRDIRGRTPEKFNRLRTLAMVILQPTLCSAAVVHLAAS